MMDGGPLNVVQSYLLALGAHRVPARVWEALDKLKEEDDEAVDA